MQMSRRELLDDFLDFVVESGDVAARDTAERLYNRALMTIWRKHPWRQFQMPQPFTFQTVTNQRFYAMPAHFGRVAGGRIRNVTKPCFLEGVEADALQALHPEAGTDEEVSGDPALYTVSGTCGLERLIATPEPLTIVSSSAQDTTNVRWTVEGYNSGNVWRRLTGTLQGAAPVTVSTAFIPWTLSKSFVEGVTPTTELTSSNGNVLLIGATNTLQRLFPEESAVEHQVLSLYPMPDHDGDTIAVPYMRRPVRSLYDSDAVPMDWTEAIFEEMVIQWRVNQGEMNVDAANNSIRPKFLDLLAFENANRAGYPHRTRPFIG